MHLDKFKKIVIKVGSSILVNDRGEPKKKWLHEISEDIKDLINISKMP